MSKSTGHDLSGIAYQGNQNHTYTQVAIVTSKWNEEITEALKLGASTALRQAGVPEANITHTYVPGSYELPAGAQMMLEGNPELDGVISLGCVIQGETRHFEFICQAVAQGISRVGLDYKKPVIFGVLTPDTYQQAADRAGGKYGNNGIEAAVALLEMIDLQRSQS